MSRLLLACCLAFAAACAGAPPRSSEARASSAPARVEFRHLRQNQKMVLVNQAHTDRVEYYSRQRSDLSTKIATDEDMDALVEYLHGQSRFLEYSRPGPAPASGYIKYAEAQLPRGTFHWGIGDHTPKAEADAFLAWQMNFIGLWNDVAQLQSVSSDFEFRPPPARRAGQP